MTNATTKFDDIDYLFGITDGKTDAEISAAVAGMDDATVKRFCRANQVFAGESGDYREAARRFLTDLRENLMLTVF